MLLWLMGGGSDDPCPTEEVTSNPDTSSGTGEGEAKEPTGGGSSDDPLDINDAEEVNYCVRVCVYVYQ